ncbi:response regulator transcription factor [Lacrimispora sp.]|uniref:response regulator transcription factor n=1 Tax=Lacrimispora sp. TaxID=2719234 RepID=UPI002FD9BDA1
MKRKIMIVDDSIVTRSEIEQLLTGTDFDVIGQYRSGEEALEAYEREKPDIVTMDIIMPGIDGIETSRRLLERYPDARIIIISSLVYNQTLEMVKSLGPSIPFVFKPIKKSYFISALLKVCDTLPR